MNNTLCARTISLLLALSILVTSFSAAAVTPRSIPVLLTTAAIGDLELEEEDILVEEGDEPTTAPMDDRHQSPSQPPPGEQTERTEEAPDSPPQPAADAVVKKDTATVVTAEIAPVEETRSINFAENVKGYRSPRLAMLLSLIVPGLGQAYAGQYWKTAAFLAAEAAVIGVSVSFARKGQDFYRQARAHADTTYSYTAFRGFYDSLKTGLQQSTRGAEDTAFARTVLDGIFYGGDEELEKEHVKKSDRYYRLIEASEFVWGWADRYPGYNSLMVQDGENAPLPYTRGDTVLVTGFGYERVPYKIKRVVNGEVIPQDEKDGFLGFSSHFLTYKSLVQKQNDNYRNAIWTLYVLLVNHIGSALEAGIAAKQYNDRLLNTQSVWDRIGVDQHFVNTGSETVPGLSLTVKF